MTSKKRVLLIDALNLFMRNYIVDPSLSTNGQPIGGTKGFIKSLQSVCRTINPDLIFVAWDGGSQKRKSIDKNYKAGRKPVRLNRDIHNMTAGEQEDNKNWQQQRLIEYLNEMPILQSYVENVEADDIIALVSQSQALSEHHKIILSSDKDFIQLCDDTTILYRPIQKEILNKKRILVRTPQDYPKFRQRLHPVVRRHNYSIQTNPKGNPQQEKDLGAV